MVVFGQSVCVRARWFYLGNIVLFEYKWLYSGKGVVFGKGGSIRAKWLNSAKN